MTILQLKKSLIFIMVFTYFIFEIQAQDEDRFTFLLGQVGSSGMQIIDPTGTTLKDYNGIRTSSMSGRFISSYATNGYWSMDISGEIAGLAGLITQGVSWDPTSYSLSLAEFTGGWTINKNNPITLGPASFQFGLGGSIGVRMFSVMDQPETSSYIGYIGPVIHSFVNIGSRIQILNLNEFDVITASEGMGGSRLKIDAIITYKVLKWLGLTVNPSIERFHHDSILIEDGNLISEEDHDFKYQFSMLQFGFSILR